jgi:hypothetical protein
MRALPANVSVQDFAERNRQNVYGNADDSSEESDSIRTEPTSARDLHPIREDDEKGYDQDLP